MHALVERKYYVLSGALRVVISGENALHAAIKALDGFRGDKLLAPMVAVNEVGFESLLTFDSNNPDAGHNFQTDYVLNLLTN